MPDVVSSHIPTATNETRTPFARNPLFKWGQEKPYESDPNLQAKARGDADNWIPAFIFTDNPDAINGPTIITPNNMHNTSGARRAFAQELIYTGRARTPESHPVMALRENAEKFKLDMDALDDPKRLPMPMLVRVLMERIPTNGREALELSRLFNEPATATPDAQTR
jgi:hypothetical protein